MSLCTHCIHIADLFKTDTNSFNSNQFNVSQIRDNTIILDRGNNWNVLLFKEALMIKKHRPTLNCGLVASKLFWLHFNDFIWHPIYPFNIKLIIPFLTFNYPSWLNACSKFPYFFSNSTLYCVALICFCLLWTSICHNTIRFHFDTSL